MVFLCFFIYTYKEKQLLSLLSLLSCYLSISYKVPMLKSYRYLPLPIDILFYLFVYLKYYLYICFTIDAKEKIILIP